MGYARAREGDLVETLEGLIFDVKGLVQPPDKVVAYLRYIEDPSGDRRRGDKTYVKLYSLDERERTLRSRYPQYLYYDPVFGEYLDGVPNRLIAMIYQPRKKVLELLSEPSQDVVETQSIEFVQEIQHSSGVPLGKLGLSGSILVNLHTDESDIDLVVYGREDCKSVHEALRRLMRGSQTPVSRYGFKGLKKLYESRMKDTHMPFRDFLRMEKRKLSQGKFKGRDFFVRFLPDWDEVDEKYGDRLYRVAGYAKIGANVEDDSESIFTPCRYVISGTRILEGSIVPPPMEIVSFRGRFCEQAKKGEKVIAQGKVEKVIDKDGSEYFRLILGAKPSDFMISIR